MYNKGSNIISDKVKTEKWGNKSIQKLSGNLQNELNGLGGFSYSNLKNMRRFYEEWQLYFSMDLLKNQISQTVTCQFQNAYNQQKEVTNQIRFKSNIQDQDSLIIVESERFSIDRTKWGITLYSRNFEQTDDRFLFTDFVEIQISLQFR